MKPLGKSAAMETNYDKPVAVLAGKDTFHNILLGSMAAGSDSSSNTGGAQVCCSSCNMGVC